MIRSCFLVLVLLFVGCQSNSASSQQHYVLLTFDIDESGSPENTQVIESISYLRHDTFAIEALRKWKYSPYIVNGLPSKRLDQRVKLEFDTVQK
ncbi:TonB family protein [Grimontia marina]|uniref:Gram-negative bacterial tonB protein n=1 Tax=Grimontia marina TaxID=646534 RepID=A0A128FGY1_9GAMM|nr:Gram-negative bacterial tonB protein [Grimontia marina]